MRGADDACSSLAQYTGHVSEHTPKRRPTIDDVARESGVSRGTVSRVLNGGHWVSPTARDAVERAIKKTGYLINPHARNLATARANSIAFLLTEPQDRLFEDPNFSTLMRGAADALAARDLPLVLLMAGIRRRAAARDRVHHGRARRRRAARVVAPRPRGVPRRPRRRRGARRRVRRAARVRAAHRLRRRRRPRRRARPRRATCASRVARASRRSPARSTPPAASAGSRATGASSATRSTSASSPRATTPARAACAAMGELLDRAPDLDAVFVANDLMAAGALDVLRERGIRVPDDVAVGGLRRRPDRDPRRARRSRRCASRSTASRRRWCGCCST